MTRDDITRMARDCGINFHQAGWPELERFFHMAQEAEREALAQHFEQTNEGGIHSAWVAAAIRERGQA